MRFAAAQEFVTDLVTGDNGIVHHTVVKVGKRVVSWRFYFDDGGVGELQIQDDNTYAYAILKRGNKVKKGVTNHV